MRKFNLRFALSLMVIFCLTLTYAGHVFADKNEERGGAAPGEWTIVASYTIPGKASGLAYDGQYLYSGIYGANSDQIYRIDPADGSYTVQFSNPSISDAFGLTWDGVNLWTIIQPPSSADPAQATEMDMTTGTFLDQIILPDHYMSGIAWDNGDFWVATYYPDPGTIYKIDADGNVLTQFQSPDQQPWDLCLENDNIWVADYYGNMIYKIDRQGTILESHASQNLKPSGIVYDGQYLWYVDGELGSPSILYKVDLGGSGTPVIYVPVTQYNYGPVTVGDSAVFAMQIENTGDGDLTIDNIVIPDSAPIFTWFALPVTVEAGHDTIFNLIYKPQDTLALNVIVTIYCNDPVTPQVEVTLLGQGVMEGPSIHVVESYHDYHQVRVNATTRWYAEVQNAGSQSLIIDALEFDDPHFYLDPSVSLPLQVPIEGSVNIGIWFYPQEDISYSGTLSIFSNDPESNPVTVLLEGTGNGQSWPIGEMLWHYNINTSYDNSPKAIAPIPDISGDGVPDVIICSEDDYVRCFNGNSSGVADMLWEREIYAGAVYRQTGLTVTGDVNNDGYSDAIIGSAWGDRSIICLSGKDGDILWKHDTHEYGDGGWVYQVDCRYDYNNDSTPDVLAATGNDANHIGPRRVYCLNALNGAVIWERMTGGPVFAVQGIEDATGDGQPDAVAGASDDPELEGRVYGIDGSDGHIFWTHITSGSSVWAVAQTDDVNGDGIKDIAAGDFNGNVMLLDATNGTVLQSSGIGPNIILSFKMLDDINGDGHRDILIGHAGTNAVVDDGITAGLIWLHPVADKPWNVDRIADISGDGINDAIVGTLFSNNYVYFLDGTDGTELKSIALGEAVDALASIPDITGDGSMEAVAGGRDGDVYCYSGGLDASVGIPGQNKTSEKDLSLTAFPNPFNTTTNLNFTINKGDRVTIEILDSRGTVINTLAEASFKSGSHHLVWDGKNAQGNVCPDGLYLALMRCGMRTWSCKIIKQ